MLIERFSALALASVVTLAISGTYAALLHMTSVSELWTTEYGRGAAAQARPVRRAARAWRLQPVSRAAEVRRLGRAYGHRRREQGPAAPLSARLRGEVVLGVLAIGAVGFLTNTAPPSVEARRQPTPVAAAPSPAVPPPTSAPLPTRTPVPSKPFAETKQVEDLQIGLSVTPAILGKNNFRVSLRDAAGQPVDVQKVVLSLEMQEMDKGVNQVEVTPQGTGEFEAPEGWLSMVGHWDVRWWRAAPTPTTWRRIFSCVWAACFFF